MEHIPSQTPPEQAGYSDREVTELGDFDGVLSRSNGPIRSSEMGQRTSVERDRGYVQSIRRSIAIFWKRQVYATVPHDACRDHLGT